MTPAVAAAQLLSSISMNGAQPQPHAHSQQQHHHSQNHSYPQHARHDSSSSQHDYGNHQDMNQSYDQRRRDPLELPFGYGDVSLLTDEDTKLLSTFFQTIETDSFGSSWGEGLTLNSGWQQFDDPSATFDTQAMLEFGQQYIKTYSENNNSHLDTPLPPNHPELLRHQAMTENGPPTHNGIEVTPEIYEAAVTLVQDNGGGMQGSLQQNYSYSSSSHGQRYNGQRSNGSDYYQSQHSHSISGPSYNGSNVVRRSSMGRRSVPMNMQWGTDSSFSNVGGYVPASEREASEMLQQQQATTIGNWFTVNQSAATTVAPTRATSPIDQQQQTLADRQSPKRAIDDATAEDTESDSEKASQPPATKRRKSMHTRLPSAAKALANSASSSKKTKASSSGADTKPSTSASTPTHDTDDAKVTTAVTASGQDVSVNGTSGSAPSSGTSSAAASTSTPRQRKVRANAKQPRKNLTDQQKRENHIVSEQRRRTAIKVGFEELTEMVPGIKGGGFSKSAVLNITCEWLQELLEGNAQLESLI
ncbi:hypothetical protein TD95_002759 [Thielaviopsis punctulata]|uniref:BHLH domain-containing protein n=1 Tax=Thielaviopsis punctulata TaxID=72032 RepID=A0A0F4ZBP5_9PEZI|nr:hypothetical protein TD95_002759 [Thielaviopsis punctulata]